MNIIINGYDQLHQIFSAFPSQNFIASAIEPSPEGLPFAKAGPLVTDGNDLGQLCIAGIADIQELCLGDDPN